MASSINENLPVQGSPTTQSVRDNFGYAKAEIEALQTDKANLASPTFTGTVTASNITGTGTVNISGTFQIAGTSVTASAAQLNHCVGVTSPIQAQIDLKAPVSTTVTLTGAQTVADKTLTAPVLDRPTEGVVALGAGTALDMSAGSIFQKTFTGNTTLTLSNVPASGFFAFAIEMTNAGSQVTFSFGGTIQWPGGTEPSWSASGTDTVTFYTTDGGATFRANVFGQAWA